jgi:hypothetical protein
MNLHTLYVTSQPDGETFIVRFDGRIPVAVAGPLYYEDVTKANLLENGFDYESIYGETLETLFPTGYGFPEEPYEGDRVREFELMEG